MAVTDFRVVTIESLINSMHSNVFSYTNGDQMQFINRERRQWVKIQPIYHAFL